MYKTKNKQRNQIFQCTKDIHNSEKVGIQMLFRPLALILGSCGTVMSGASMVVSKSEVWVEEESLTEPEEKQEGENSPKAEVASPEILNQAKHRMLQKSCHQQFEFRDGHIFSSCIPNLVLGVQHFKLHSGSGIVLVKKNCFDKHQKWLHKEESRTFHLMINPNLVLAVALPTVSMENLAKIKSFPVIIQTYKPYSNGASNQKWLYLKNKNILKAFHSSKMDIEVTIANHAGICTSTVTNEEEVNQVGYSFRPPGSKTRVMICLACARSVVSQKDLKKLFPGIKFFCAFGSRECKQFTLRNPKVINMSQSDLSSCEDENSLRHYEELLLSFQRRVNMQSLSHDILATMRQTPVKIIAHKNGTRSANGKLIIAQSFPVLLSGCTLQLGLNRAASRLYTYDGTAILNLNNLILWAINEFLKNRDSEDKKYTSSEENKEMATQSAEDKKTNQGDSKPSPQIMMPARFHSFNSSLLSHILKNPIEVWVSCGEPFIPLDALQRSEKLQRKNWLKKDRILADLEVMKHKMRQLKGRRVFESNPGNGIYPICPGRGTVLRGNWMEPSQEERKLLKYIISAKARLTEVQSHETKCNSPVSTKQTSLYLQPNTKRVFAYLSGHEHEDGFYVWGRSIAELLNESSLRLGMMCPAKTMYTLDGKPLTSWNDIKRDMVICVSAGNHFVSQKDIKQRVSMRANYARIRKLKGPHATDIVAFSIERPQSKTNRSDSILSLHTASCFEGWDRPRSATAKQMITVEKPFKKK
ncbi:doublecortin domain-containing protein 1 [Sarcophilus harrisii]|uniref:Doublecortin domain containing 1 n=1 Tax=Sarcophilus harrisii TaxID=9305 RepID=G3WKY5_SARHA|nr:doublecortin domain-containing protein 1 [Sarcophilus harrisii]